MRLLPRPRRSMTVLLSSMLVLALAGPAAAHVSIEADGQIVAGGSGTLGIRITHGCGEAPTDTVEVLIPEGVTGVQAAWVPGWTAETDVVETEPYELFGETLTERVGVVRWIGGSIPTDVFYDFTIVATFAEGIDRLVFPTVQRCGEEELAWIQLASSIDEGETLEFPAPALTLAGVADAANDSAGKSRTGKDKKPKKAKKGNDDGHDHEHG